MEDQEPADPVGFLAEGTATQHEIFCAYVAAGFTRPEALKIIIAMITTGMRTNGG